MKKLCSTLLICCLLFIFLTACNKSKAQKEPAQEEPTSTRTEAGLEMLPEPESEVQAEETSTLSSEINSEEQEESSFISAKDAEFEKILKENELYLTLVNKTTKLPDNWSGLVTIETTKNSLGEEIQIEYRTLEAFDDLRNELLEKEGIQIELDSVYRSVEEQQEIWDEWSADPNNKNGGFKAKTQKLKAKLLKSYYGNPMKDMKLIAITGTTGKTTVAHYVHEILRAADEQVAVLASDQPFKTQMLHKFLSDAWKAGANYVIVTVPAETLRDNVFYGLPVHVAAMTNFITAGLNDLTPEEFIDNEKTLFKMKPEIVVLNHDDANFDSFEDFKGTKQTIEYGLTGKDVKILNSKLYPKGTEAKISVKSEIIDVATFIPGETAVSYMACAVAIASAIGIKHDDIIDGIAEYTS